MLSRPGMSTLAVHGTGPEAGMLLVTPLARSTVLFQEGGRRYARFGSPSLAAAGRRLAALEGAAAVGILSSGTAAITCTLLALTPPGGMVVASRQVCGDALSVLEHELPSLGRETRFVDVDDWAGWRSALSNPRASVAYLETISNPLLRVADLPRLAEIAHLHGARVVADATFSTPIHQRPLGQGCDVVVHSAGKYLNGHADVIVGAVAGPESLVADIDLVASRIGCTADAAAGSLLERGLKTLALRMERHSVNGAAVGEWLRGRCMVAATHSPSLVCHRDHALAAELLARGPGVVSIELVGGDHAARRFADGLSLIQRAPTVGAAESLVWLPRIDAHASEPGQALPDGLVRISCGLEDTADILADLKRGLSAVQTTVAGLDRGVRGIAVDPVA